MVKPHSWIFQVQQQYALVPLEKQLAAVYAILVEHMKEEEDYKVWFDFLEPFRLGWKAAVNKLCLEVCSSLLR